MMNYQTVEYISECFVQPKHTPQESTKPLYLSAWDLAILSCHYNQKGLLFAKPPSLMNSDSMKDFLEKLKESLSIVLIHFYPLTGRLATLKQGSPSIYVDCANGPGAKFVHGSLNLTISDILSPIYVPKIVYSFFDHVGAVNYDGHTRPLLTVQVTELIDGIFIGLSVNHTLVDGTSFWHFINSWSEIFNAGTTAALSLSISRPPNHNRWSPILRLPSSFSHPDEFISRYQVPAELKERVFHFSAASLQKLKAKANAESTNSNISSFQALCGHLWRCITRAWKLNNDQTTRFSFSVDNRSRITPPLPEGYFGNSIQELSCTLTCGELLNDGVGWAALKLHELVINQSDKAARGWAESWAKQPWLSNFYKFPPNSILVGSSPRFDVYGNDFGLGKALGVRSGFANKIDGKIMLFPAREGGGNVDMEICLLPPSMACLESDLEFLEAVSFPTAPFPAI